MNDIKIIAVAVALLIAGLGGYRYGASTTTAHYEAQISERDRKDAQAVADAMQQGHAQAVAVAAISQTSVQNAAAIDTHYQAITKKVVQYVHDHPTVAACGLDADGLGLWNDANAGNGDGH